MSMIPVRAARDRRAVPRAMLRQKLRRILTIGSTIMLFAGAPVRAENLDAGKSPARLFADSCATCHRSPRGLAKGRFRLTLYLFLQQHYSSSSGSAWALSSYLESLDTPVRGPVHSARPVRSGFRPARPPRPPMPVPHR
jgi:hypothetical protein